MIIQDILVSMRKKEFVNSFLRKNPVGRPAKDVRERIRNELIANPHRAYTTPELAREIKMEERTTYNIARTLVKAGVISCRKLGLKTIWLLEGKCLTCNGNENWRRK